MHRLGSTRKPQHQNGGFLVLRSFAFICSPPKKSTVNPNGVSTPQKNTNWRKIPRYPGTWHHVIFPAICHFLSAGAVHPSWVPASGTGILDPYLRPSWRSIAQCQVVKIGQCILVRYLLGVVGHIYTVYIASCVYMYIYIFFLYNIYILLYILCIYIYMIYLFRWSYSDWSGHFWSFWCIFFFWWVLGENALGWYLSDLCCPLSEVGCIEVLPCVKSSRLAISVSWLSGGIPRKKTTWHSAIWLPSQFQTPCRFAYTSLLLHDFYA